jgi:hypothetical protein
MLTPTKVHDLVFTKKPTGDPERRKDRETGAEIEDEEYLTVVAKGKKFPKEGIYNLINSQSTQCLSLPA